jgi:hypothetical protein
VSEESEEEIPGASRPPFRSEPSPAHFPAEPIVPRRDGGIELAEALSLPTSLQGFAPALGSLPTDAAEARVYFTMLTRELGRLFRERFGVELRTDLRGIEIVQRELVERFADRDVLGPDEIDEIRRSGAFVSEVLARRLGAEWIDLSSADVGRWAMSVRPGTTIWPIGRVIRFVTMRHRERDLTSYFLELQARAHGLR